MGRIKRIWYLSPMRAAKVQASLRIRAVSPEPPLLAHTSSKSKGTFRQKARSLAPLNGWACAVKICHDGMLEDTNSLDGAQMFFKSSQTNNACYFSLTSQYVNQCRYYTLALVLIPNKYKITWVSQLLSEIHLLLCISLASLNYEKEAKEPCH